MLGKILYTMYSQLYARKSKFVPDKLRKKWDSLNLYYMSEEEDTEDNKKLYM
jgi:hypothetical protein